MNIDLISTYLGYISAIVATASAIAALTPTPKDDQVISIIYKVIDILALNIGKAKDTGKVD